jgi:hypothetical protein
LNSIAGIPSKSQPFFIQPAFLSNLHFVISVL